MPSYKLIYFDFRGRGELIRFMFAQAGVSYEDKRIALNSKEWADLKPVTPFGLLPVLEIDGEPLTGSTVIARYLAELSDFDLAGSKELDNAHIAAIGNFITDLEMEIAPIVRGKFTKKDEQTMEILKKEFVEECVPKFISKLELLSSTNPNGYLWKNQLTWIDFYMYQMIDWIKIHVQASFLDSFPNLRKLCDTIEGLPNIAKWISERPDSDY